MAAYTVRVEFEGEPSPKKYEHFNQSMAQEGFERTVNGVRSESPVIISLPSGLYFGHSSQTAPQVAEDIYAAACGIHPVAAVFVIETTTWASK